MLDSLVNKKKDDWNPPPTIAGRQGHRKDNNRGKRNFKNNSYRSTQNQRGSFSRPTLSGLFVS